MNKKNRKYGMGFVFVYYLSCWLDGSLRFGFYIINIFDKIFFFKYINLFIEYLYIYYRFYLIIFIEDIFILY
jgi:hypothetical protein